MNWRRIICLFKDHRWQIVEGKRHCTYCDHKPKDDGVRFCPKCGSERLMGNIMVSEGYQYTSCQKCGHKYQEPSAPVVTVAFGDHCYELERPEVDQEGNRIEPREDLE